MPLAARHRPPGRCRPPEGDHAVLAVTDGVSVGPRHGRGAVRAAVDAVRWPSPASPASYPVPVDFDTRVGCYAWIEREGHVLLPHWRERGADGREHAGWTLPGGGMEHGESPEGTCRREVWEETGFTVELDGLLGVRNHWIPVERRRHAAAGRPLQGLQVVYLARVAGGTLTREVDGTTDDVRWVPLDELPGLQTVTLVDAAAQWAAARRGVLS